MGALGNGRRGGRSPPLLIGALIACILVLGFNYWVASSRSLELQTKLYELEGAVRRGAAERGAEEAQRKEAQEESQRQREEVGLGRRRLEETQHACSLEKGMLQLNISSSTSTILDLKSQLNMLNEDLLKVQKSLHSCEGSLDSVNKKITYELTQCNTQILAQREECVEKVAAARLDLQKKLDKKTTSAQVKVPPTQKTGSSEKVGVAEDKEAGLGKAGLDDTKTTLPHSHAPEFPQVQSDVAELKASEMLETNEIAVDKGLEAPPSLNDIRPETPPPEVTQGDQASPEGARGATAPTKKKSLVEDDMEVMDTQLGDAVAGADDILIGQAVGLGPKEEAAIGQKEEGPDDYDADEQIVGRAKPNHIPDNIDRALEEELADYNGDEDNEGEFEADKQAELAQI